MLDVMCAVYLRCDMCCRLSSDVWDANNQREYGQVQALFFVVYKKKQYTGVVKVCTTLSVEAGVEEVKKRSSYANDGEVYLVCGGVLQ